MGLDYHTSIPEQPPGESWYAGMGITIDPRWGRTYIYANARNKNTDYELWEACSIWVEICHSFAILGSK